MWPRDIHAVMKMQLSFINRTQNDLNRFETAVYRCLAFSMCQLTIVSFLTRFALLLVETTVEDVLVLPSLADMTFATF